MAEKTIMTEVHQVPVPCERMQNKHRDRFFFVTGQGQKPLLWKMPLSFDFCLVLAKTFLSSKSNVTP